MNNFTILKYLNSGAYGSIYLVENGEGEQQVLKQINKKGVGVDCLIEAIIMASVINPYINNANTIFITDSLNIVQNVALSDLAQETRGKIISLSKLERWSYKIILALKHLHKNNFIHADVKAANILYYGSDDKNEIKLTDFTLSVRKFDESDIFSQPACTYSHAPPESLIDSTWDETLDVWSLGCTMYEIAFGRNLFTDQMDKHDDHKSVIKNRYYNTIIDFLERHDLCDPSGQDEPYFRSTTVDEYHDNKYKTFKNLLSKIIVYDPVDRIELCDIFDDPFFKEVGPSFYPDLYSQDDSFFKTSSKENMSEKEYDDISLLLDDILYKLKDYEKIHIKRNTLSLYQKTLGVPRVYKKGSIDLVLVTCIWISLKLISGSDINFDMNYKIEELIRMEKDICYYTSFCLLDYEQF